VIALFGPLSLIHTLSLSHTHTHTHTHARARALDVDPWGFLPVSLTLFWTLVLCLELFDARVYTCHDEGTCQRRASRFLRPDTIPYHTPHTHVTLYLCSLMYCAGVSECVWVYVWEREKETERQHERKNDRESRLMGA